MGDFRDTRSILNRRPNIAFVEPDQVEPERPTADPQPDTDELRNRMQTVVNQYKRVEKLADIAQKRIDDRAKNSKVCMSRTQDAAVIAALKRQFGTDDSCITYEQYKHCLQKISKSGQEVAPYNTPQQMRDAIRDPFRKDLGGSGSQPGQLRPELQVQSPVQPIDTDQFQKESAIELFKMLFPMISGLTDFKIVQHTATLPGHFT